jgi:hypothetical protein
MRSCLSRNGSVTSKRTRGKSFAATSAYGRMKKSEKLQMSARYRLMVSRSGTATSACVITFIFHITPRNCYVCHCVLPVNAMTHSNPVRGRGRRIGSVQSSIPVGERREHSHHKSGKQCMAHWLPCWGGSATLQFNSEAALTAWFRKDAATSYHPLIPSQLQFARNPYGVTMPRRFPSRALHFGMRDVVRLDRRFACCTTRRLELTPDDFIKREIINRGSIRHVYSSWAATSFESSACARTSKKTPP